MFLVVFRGPTDYYANYVSRIEEKKEILKNGAREVFTVEGESIDALAETARRLARRRNINHVVNLD